MPKSLDIIHPEKDYEPSEPTESSKEDFEVEEPKEGGGVFYLVLGVVALLLAAGISLYVFLKDSGNKNGTNAVATTTAEESAVESATASVTETETITASAQESKTVNITGTVRVANGNSINGEGKRIAQILKEDGFNIVLVNNATKAYTSSIIYYKTGKEDLAKALQTSLEKEYKAEIQKSDSIASQYDAVVTLGAK